MAIKAVLFDLDNTLTHRDLSIQAYARHLLNHFSTALSHQNEAQYQKTLEIIRRIDHGGYPKKECLTQPSIAGSVADALIQHLDWQSVPQLKDLTEFWFSQFGLSAVAMAGAEQLLKTLKAQHYRLAVISNGGHATRLKILEGLGFISYFDEILSSESVGISKPNAEIFLYACSKLNVDPQHSVYIGDHPVNDYQGATQAGLNALLLSGFHEDHHLKYVPENKIIHQLDQLWNYL